MQLTASRGGGGTPDLLCDPLVLRARLVGGARPDRGSPAPGVCGDGAAAADLRRVPAVPDEAGGSEAVRRVPRGVLLHARGRGGRGGVPARGVGWAQGRVQGGDAGEAAGCSRGSVSEPRCRLNPLKPAI